MNEVRISFELAIFTFFVLRECNLFVYLRAMIKRFGEKELSVDEYPEEHKKYNIINETNGSSSHEVRLPLPA